MSGSVARQLCDRHIAPKGVEDETNGTATEATVIAEFARRYPAISFDFDLTPRLVDLVSEPFDAAIRMGKPPDSNLIARQLASLPCYLYASLRYLK